MTAIDRATLDHDVVVWGLGPEESVTLHTPAEWLALARGALLELCERGNTFDSRDHRILAPDSPGVHPNARGGVFQWAARKGYAEQIGVVRTSRRKGHSHYIGVWRGTGVLPD